jgi:hypothetical protein
LVYQKVLLIQFQVPLWAQAQVSQVSMFLSTETKRQKVYDDWLERCLASERKVSGYDTRNDDNYPPR